MFWGEAWINLCHNMSPTSLFSKVHLGLGMSHLFFYICSFVFVFTFFLDSIFTRFLPFQFFVCTNVLVMSLFPRVMLHGHCYAPPCWLYSRRCFYYTLQITGYLLRCSTSGMPLILLCARCVRTLLYIVAALSSRFCASLHLLDDHCWMSSNLRSRGPPVPRALHNELAYQEWWFSTLLCSVLLSMHGIHTNNVFPTNFTKSETKLS